ncbi:MAG TPA: C25 family cysteine peptidase [Thermoanaerobaculia bacterium]
MRKLSAAAPRSAVLSLAGSLALSLPLLAGSTGSTALMTPQGSAAGQANGEYISAPLNTAYRFFIEVPPGTSRLVVEIFDADVGLGGANEDTAGRDRDRNGYNTTATYSLRNPAGTTRTTQFTTGNTTLPAASDNAWVSLFDSTGDYVRDQFGTAAYNNNDGLIAWDTNWIETNDDNDATNGQIRVTGGELRIGDNGGAASTIEREADLSGASSATLSFNFRTQGVDAGDQMRVEISANGGGSWTTLETFTGAFAASSRSYNISAFATASTRVRFIEVNGYGNNDFFFVDNAQMQKNGVDAGHWEVRIDQTATGDDINAVGIRAHDGTSGSGGTELNVYIDSQSAAGVNPPASGTQSRNYDLFPYITSGCTASTNDFDYDENGSLVVASRTGAFSRTYSNAALSNNAEWVRNSFSGWTTDQRAIDYGIWSLDQTISSYLVGGTPNGNYAHVWFGNYQAAGPTPAANPTANAFRIYLPTDAGAAPPKPYVEQLLTFSGCGLSGPNPPVVGQTSCFTVTVNVVNEAAQTVTFSASNLVTTNVPGSGAVYAGGAQVSQGSIVSQPSVGGTGNITWNPGTLAAGARAQLSYRVNVTPTSAGQRIPVTGTPASNGTRAQYLDETANTTQSRATYLFGPLCELAVTENLLTVAVVSSFRVLPAEGGGVLVEWSTASEVGTAGFDLQRWDKAARRWAPVNRELLAGLLHAPQGGVYRFVDEGASPSEPQVYRLIEVEAGGGRRVHGPFRVNVDWNVRSGGAGAYESKAHPARRTPAPPASTLKLSRPIPSSPYGVHLAVEETGLYYLPANDVSAWLGLKLKEAEKDIADGRLSLTRDGMPVAWQPDLYPDRRGAGGLFFYGEASGGLYSDASVYRLYREPGDSGMLMATVNAPAAFAGGGGLFTETRHTERDVLPATAVASDPESDYWYWEFLQGGDPTYGRRTFTLDAPGVSPTLGGALTVSLQGATTTGVAGEHRVAVALNGAPLGETSWQGLEGATATFAIPPGLLIEAGNQVEVTASLGGGAPYSFTYVDGFDLSYQRSLRAAGDALAFNAETSAPLTVSGFSNPNVRLLDVTDPLYPRWVAGATVQADGDGGYRLTFAARAGARYLAAAPAGTHVSAWSRPWSAPWLRSPDRRIEYLVIAPQSLWTAAERLAALRRDQGLTAETAYLDQIADEFGGGALTPQALRSFLAWAWGNWTVKPRYVVLAGEGTLDYRDLQGYGGNLVPPLMVKAEGGLFPSDNRLGDVDGDGLPEMAVGRIPVLTAAELNAYIDKIAAYESAPPAAWTRSALFLADAPDRGADFTAESERIAGVLPDGYDVDRIYLSDTPLPNARGRLLGALNSGAALLNYVGHGGLDRLSGGGLLTSADVPGLGNSSRLPVVTAMTCTINRFAVPGVPALGELLAKAPSGGAAAVWGPSGLSSTGQARLLAERFYHPGGEARLGDRILRAVREFREAGGDPALPVLYDLMGDPALKMVGAAKEQGGSPVGNGE